MISCVAAAACAGCGLIVDGSTVDCAGGATCPGASPSSGLDAAGASGDATGDCLEGWITGPTGSCYFPLGTAEISMQEAGALCAALIDSDPPPHLVTIETLQEQIFIRDNVLVSSDFWIGLCDCTTWEWLTGEPVTSENDYGPLITDDVTGRCAQMDNEAGGAWKTRRCTNGGGTSLCELDGRRTVVSP